MIGYKPLEITVGTSSVMILPPVVPKDSEILSYENSTAYTYGQIVRNGGKLYWCVSAGNSGTGDGPTHSDGDAADGTVSWRTIRPRRNALAITNLQTVDVSLGFDNEAEAGKGEVLTTTGSNHKDGFGGGRCFQGAVYAIAASGSANKLGIQEF